MLWGPSFSIQTRLCPTALVPKSDTMEIPTSVPDRGSKTLLQSHQHISTQDPASNIHFQNFPFRALGPSLLPSTQLSVYTAPPPRFGIPTAPKHSPKMRLKNLLTQVNSPQTQLWKCCFQPSLRPLKPRFIFKFGNPNPVRMLGPPPSWDSRALCLPKDVSATPQNQNYPS